MPGQVIAAVPLTVEVGEERPFGEDLHGPVQGRRVELGAVQDVELAALVRVGLEVRAQPKREKDGIGVDLHRPVMLLEPAVLLGNVPDLQEGLGVEPRVCRGTAVEVPHLFLDRRDDSRHDLHAARCDAHDYRLAPVAEDGVLVAHKDASTPVLLLLHERHLVALRPDHGQAVERGPAPGRGRGRGPRRAGRPRGRGPRCCRGRGGGCRCCWVGPAGADGLARADGPAANL
mmetsp:Transcript_1877/g.5686  ORF Transcript_1877/g.5686 Transcript_1877/m.5686 type:complete len:231 (-) Transcript_1877:1881-2573(-)